MNLDLAVEKNREALKRILVTLLAMMSVSRAPLPALLPRHLHRLALRLLRPAEAATRRLIVIAARAMARSGPPDMPGRKLGPSGALKGLASVHLPVRTPARIVRRAFSFSLLDPLIRSKGDRGKRKPSAPLTIFGMRIPFFRRSPAPAPLSPDDPLDAGNLAGRLEAIGRALDDLPAQARRLARWQARRDAASEVAAAGRTDGSAKGALPNAAPRKEVQAELARRSRRLSPMRTRRPGNANLTLHQKVNGRAALPRIRLDTS